MYVLRTYEVIHIFLVFILLFGFCLRLWAWWLFCLLPVWPLVSAQSVPFPLELLGIERSVSLFFLLV